MPTEEIRPIYTDMGTDWTLWGGLGGRIGGTDEANREAWQKFSDMMAAGSKSMLKGTSSEWLADIAMTGAAIDRAKMERDRKEGKEKQASDSAARLVQMILQRGADEKNADVSKFEVGPEGGKASLSFGPEALGDLRTGTLGVPSEKDLPAPTPAPSQAEAMFSRMGANGMPEQPEPSMTYNPESIKDLMAMQRARDGLLGKALGGLVDPPTQQRPTQLPQTLGGTPNAGADDLINYRGEGVRSPNQDLIDALGGTTSPSRSSSFSGGLPSDPRAYAGLSPDQILSFGRLAYDAAAHGDTLETGRLNAMREMITSTPAEIRSLQYAVSLPADTPGQRAFKIAMYQKLGLIKDMDSDKITEYTILRNTLINEGFGTGEIPSLQEYLTFPQMSGIFIKSVGAAKERGAPHLPFDQWIMKYRAAGQAPQRDVYEDAFNRALGGSAAERQNYVSGPKLAEDVDKELLKDSKYRLLRAISTIGGERGKTATNEMKQIRIGAITERVKQTANTQDVKFVEKSFTTGAGVKVPAGWFVFNPTTKKYDFVRAYDE